MKFILSRKGFDSANGGHPSPIMPDRTLLSFPIPSNDNITYSELKHKNQSYFQIMTNLFAKIKFKNQLKSLNPSSTCHLDPDLDKNIYPRKPGWKGVLGQIGAAQTHLENNEIAEGDVFLFFGWFKPVIMNSKKYRYNTKKQDLHVVFGYLQIGKILKPFYQKTPSWLNYHPHVASQERRKIQNNTIYIARNRLSWDHSKPGYGVLDFQEKRVLTKKGYSRSKWVFPFKNVKISHHTPGSWKKDYFQSTPIGQEFVFEENKMVEEWAIDLITGE